MDFVERYPKLNKCLVKQYGDSYQITQSCLDTLLSFVNTLYESELESQRKEVNPYEEEVKEDTYLGRNKRKTSKLISRSKKNSVK